MRRGTGRRGRRGCGSGSGRGGRGFSLGGGSLGVGWGGFRRGFGTRRLGGGLTALGCVVVHVPAGALEMEPGRCQWALKHAVALGTFNLRLGREVLDFLKTMATLRTAIGIERQGSNPSGEQTPTLPIVSAGRQIGCKCHPALGGVHNAGFQCALMGTEPLLFSQARVSEPLPPPLSTSVYFRFSAMPGGVDIVIFARPRSIDLSYFVPH